LLEVALSTDKQHIYRRVSPNGYSKRKHWRKS